jgi:hypothetical protein
MYGLLNVVLIRFDFPFKSSIILNVENHTSAGLTEFISKIYHRNEKM